MPLSADEKSYIRDNSGDNVSGSYEISDATLQIIYDSTAEGNSSLDRTVYFVIRRRLGIAAKQFDMTDPTLPSTARYSQQYEHLKELLALWGSLTGIGTSGLSLSVTSTYTYRADSLQTEEPTYERGAVGDGVTDDL